MFDNGRNFVELNTEIVHGIILVFVNFINLNLRKCNANLFFLAQRVKIVLFELFLQIEPGQELNY